MRTGPRAGIATTCPGRHVRREVGCGAGASSGALFRMPGMRGGRLDAGMPVIVLTGLAA